MTKTKKPTGKRPGGLKSHLGFYGFRRAEHTLSHDSCIEAQPRTRADSADPAPLQPERLCT